MPLAILHGDLRCRRCIELPMSLVHRKLRELTAKSTEVMRRGSAHYSVAHTDAQFRTLRMPVPTAIKLAYLRHFVEHGATLQLGSLDGIV
jgi:hypothetical protein